MAETQQVFPEWRSFLGTAADEARFVAKRSGTVERYDRARIEAAIEKAFKAVKGIVDRERVKRIAADTESRLALMLAGRHPNSIPAIEEIQDLVEMALIEAREAQVARAYILYRARREAVRDARRLMLDINTTMDGYLAQVDWRVKENANVNYSLGGLILHNSGTVTANYWLKNIYPEEIADAHRNADFHIHDLSMFSGYCAGWSLRQLIAEGLGGVPDKITSAPARHPELHVRRQHAKPLGQPGAVHQYHARLDLPGRSARSARCTGRRRTGLHLRRLSGRDGRDQSRLHRADAGRRRGRAWLPVSDTNVQHNK